MAIERRSEDIININAPQTSGYGLSINNWNKRKSDMVFAIPFRIQIK